jgi:DNA polymerase (family 10)
MGVRVAISTDSHSIAQLDNMRYGVATARRGWLDAQDVLNTMGLVSLTDFLSH